MAEPNTLTFRRSDGSTFTVGKDDKRMAYYKSNFPVVKDANGNPVPNPGGTAVRQGLDEFVRDPRTQAVISLLPLPIIGTEGLGVLDNTVFPLMTKGYYKFAAPVVTKGIQKIKPVATKVVKPIQRVFEPAIDRISRNIGKRMLAPHAEEVRKIVYDAANEHIMRQGRLNEIIDHKFWDEYYKSVTHGTPRPYELPYIPIPNLPADIKINGVFRPYRSSTGSFNVGRNGNMWIDINMGHKAMRNSLEKVYSTAAHEGTHLGQEATRRFTADGGVNLTRGHELQIKLLEDAYPGMQDHSEMSAVNAQLRRYFRQKGYSDKTFKNIPDFEIANAMESLKSRYIGQTAEYLRQNDLYLDGDAIRKSLKWSPVVAAPVGIALNQENNDNDVREFGYGGQKAGIVCGLRLEDIFDTYQRCLREKQKNKNKPAIDVYPALRSLVVTSMRI